MAQFFKPLSPSDKVNSRTLLHEAIPLTGTIVSGTYGVENVKNFSHGMFQSTYDYPYLSSSANHVFDITCGYSSLSGLSGAANAQNAKKINIYTQMAQVLMGYDADGNVLEFDADGDLLAGGTKIKEAYFMNFSRLLVKDEIKKGSFQLELGVKSAYAEDGSVFNNRIKITDASGSNSYLVNSPVGEYGILYATQSAGPTHVMNPHLAPDGQSTPVGLVFYQAGVAVLTGSIFTDEADGGILNDSSGSCNMGPLQGPVGFPFVTGSQISGAADALRTRIHNIQFNNTVELNSAVYFCRVNNTEFNYSSNPTYLTGSKIRVKSEVTDVPVSYITTVGLYSPNDELMAVAKLSEPLKKTPDNEFTIRVRLDY
tara:strand:- start:3131 stop:4240 length:1110 start_codon:yes stop_codon:yes gene_type:complete